MGSFIGHVLPGTLFLLVGLWHVWSSVVRYISNPAAFRVSVWSPVPGFNGRFMFLELYVIVIGGFIDLCVELLVATRLRFFVNGVLDPSHMINFEHSGMLLMFFIFGAVTLLSQKTRLVFLFFSLLSSNHFMVEFQVIGVSCFVKFWHLENFDPRSFVFSAILYSFSSHRTQNSKLVR